MFNLQPSYEFDRGTFCIVESTDKDHSGYRLERREQSQSSNARCMTPYTELSLSYENSKQRLDIPEVVIDDDITTLSALAGLGLSIPLSKNLTFRPILLGGYSHIISDADFDGDFAAEFRAGLDGISADANINALLLGAAAELQHQQLFDNEIELKGHLRYNYLVSDVFDASDESLERANDFVAITGRVEASVPTGLQLLSRDLHVQGFGGSCLLLTKATEKITSDDFLHEIGGGLELRNIPLVGGIKLSASAFFGVDVVGYRAGAGVTF